MTTANFVQMRKAIIDAILLTALILYGLLFTGILFTYPWLILPIYALAYLLAVVIRLRLAARETNAAASQKQSLEEAASQNKLAINTLTEVMLYYGEGQRPPFF